MEVEKEGVLFHHTIQGDYLPCYDPKYLTENDLWHCDNK